MGRGPTEGDMGRLLLVDDEINVLNALQRSLRRWFPPGQTTMELSTEPLAALQRCREVDFDVVIADYRMPGLNGVELLTGIKALQPHTTRVMLSAAADFAVLLEAVNTAGISHYACKPWDAEELRDVILQALARNDAAARTQRRADEPAASLAVPAAHPCALALQRFGLLTPREREVLHLLVSGKSNKMIARILQISNRTVENHRAKVMQKTEANSLPELVQMALLHLP